MLKIYKPISGLDWLNYKIVRADALTYHHIKKRADGGKRSIENGAILTQIAHRYLNLIEYQDIDKYNAINKVFQIVNDQKCEPTIGQREVIECLLQQFEAEHRWDKGRKGKLLIKREYLRRS
jgi:hypothetical protein